MSAAGILWSLFCSPCLDLVLKVCSSLNDSMQDTKSLNLQEMGCDKRDLSCLQNHGIRLRTLLPTPSPALSGIWDQGDDGGLDRQPGMPRLHLN